VQHALELVRRKAAQVLLERLLEPERLVDVPVQPRQLLRQQRQHAAAPNDSLSIGAWSDV